MKFFPQRTTKFNRDKKNAGIHAFRKSNLKLVESFVREFLQNAVDAIFEEEKPVRIKMRLVEVTNSKDKQYLKEIYKDCLDLLKLSGTKPIYNSKYLVIEEFNTKGLTGTSAFEPKPGEYEDAHWSNYSFGMFRESKTGDAAGRNGVGKIMNNLLSGIRCVIYKTHRSELDPSEINDEVWIGGRMEYEECPEQPEDDDGKITRYENWSWLTSSIPDGYDWNNDDHITEVYKPTNDSETLKRFDQIFDIERDDNEYGTTWIIPSPLQEDTVKKTGEKVRTEMTDLEEIINHAITEYAWAFFSDQLEIDFDGKKIDQGNIKEELIERYPDRSEFWEFLDDVIHFDDNKLIPIDKSWQDERQITDDLFTETNLENLRRAFQDTAEGEMLGFGVPITVHKKINEGTSKRNRKKDSALRVFLKKPSSEVAMRRESLFVRKNLVLSGEKSITKNQKAFCVVHIRHFELSTFCANAENEDHTKLDAHKYQLEQKYVRCYDTVRMIRSSARVIFEALESYSTDDFDLMIAEKFGILLPNSDPLKKRKKRKKRKKIDGTGTKPKQSRAYFKCNNTNEFILEPGSDKLNSAACPFELKIVLKSESSFKGVGKLDPSEIGFSKSEVLEKKGCDIVDQSADHIDILIEKPDFYLKMDPFSVRFHTKVSYIHNG